MEAYLCISLKRAAAKQIQAVNDGMLTRDQAEKLIKDRCRFSGRMREQLIEGLTREYDQESVQAFQFFRLL